jgi:hypothetical protein
MHDPNEAAVEADSAAQERTDAAAMPRPEGRAPTLDDVRGNDGTHRALALGCSAVVIVAVVAFWLVRVVLLR